MLHVNIFLKRALVLVCFGLGSCASSSLGDKLGVSVQGRASTVSLDWDALHGWNQAISRGGAQLVAEYVAPGQGLVREVLAGARTSRERGIDFQLPELLKSVPAGEVCLYIQIPAMRALLPVRKSAQGQDTARFRYPGWDAQVKANSSARYLMADLETLTQQSQEVQQLLQQRQQRMVQRGQPDVASCAAIAATAPSSAAVQPPPISVVPANRRRAVAEQVCTHRVAVGRRLFEQRLAGTKSEGRAEWFRKFGGLTLLVPEAADLLLQMQPAATQGLVPAALQERKQQARWINETWRTYAGTVGRDFWPPFGNQTDYLEIIADAQAANTFLLLQAHGQRFGLSVPAQAPSARDQFGALGAMMDAFQGCVDDGMRQLQAAAQNWEDLQAQAPQRARRLRDHFVAECRRDHEQIDLIRKDAQRLNDDLQQLRHRAAGTAQPQGPLPTQRQALNDLRCGAS